LLDAMVYTRWDLSHALTKDSDMTRRPTYRSLITAAVSVLALTACAAGPAALTEQPPVRLEQAPAGQLPSGATPLAYRLDLKTDPKAEGFTGVVEIDLALDQPHARVWLHALGPDILYAAARLADGSVVPATFTGNQADGGVGYLDFATPLPAGTVTLVMDYEAPYNFGLAGLYKVTQAGKDYLATQMEAIDARRMVPSFDEPRFKTPWTLSVTAPAGDKVVANAALAGSADLGDGSVKHTFAPTRPIQSYLVALVVGPYDEVAGEMIAATGLRPEPVPLRAFAAAGKGGKLGEALAITDEMLLWQEDYFAQPYPYGKLDLIAAPDFAYGAMENAGAIIYREGALLIDERTPLSQRRSIFSTHAHELAHQWFGNLVTPAWWDDIWLNEAFATWMAAKTMHAVDPGGEWDLNPISGGLGAMGSDGLLAARQVRNPVTRNGDINDAFDGITYQKGGSVLNMFETYLGEDKFREGIRVHMRRFADGVANVDDLMTSLSEGSGDTTITDSFRTFILQPGIPMLDVRLSCTEAGADLVVSQSRYAPLGSQIDTGAQTWQVPFSARLEAGGSSQLVKQLLTAKTETITLPACPDFLIPNAGGTGYWRFALDDASAEDLAANFSKLSAGEQMVFADSLVAGFQSGSVSAQTLLAGMAATATGAPVAAGQPFGALRSFHARLDETGRKNLSAWIEATYGPLEQSLLARPESELTDREKLLKTGLDSLLIEYGDRPGAQGELVSKVKAYIGFGQAADPAALSPNQMGTAFTLAVKQGDRTFAEAALAFAYVSENQTERGTILRAVAGNADAQLTAELVAGAASLPVSPSEMSSLVQSAFSNEAAIDPVWAAFKGSFKEIVERLPEVRKQQIAAVSGSFCSVSKGEEARAFFDSNGALITGYERRLAQGLEANALCAAQKEQLIPALAAALAGN
jgi:alanyl aminopeptidase